MVVNNLFPLITLLKTIHRYREDALLMVVRSYGGGGNEKPAANEFGKRGAVLPTKTFDTFVKSGFVPDVSSELNPPPTVPASFRTNSFAVKFTGPTSDVNTPPPALPAMLSMKLALTHVKRLKNKASTAPPAA